MTTPTVEQGATAAYAVAVAHHRITKIAGLNIFYREAGPADAPAVLLLHGFPTSSHMFRNLIPALGGPLPCDCPRLSGLWPERHARPPNSPTPSTVLPIW